MVVAEGIEHPKNRSAASHLSEAIQTYTGIETRETVLGYIQRGGSPTPMDRILATRYGAHTAQCIAKEKYGAAALDAPPTAVYKAAECRPEAGTGGHRRHPPVNGIKTMGLTEKISRGF